MCYIKFLELAIFEFFHVGQSAAIVGQSTAHAVCFHSYPYLNCLILI